MLPSMAWIRYSSGDASFEVSLSFAKIEEQSTGVVQKLIYQGTQLQYQHYLTLSASGRKGRCGHASCGTRGSCE